MTEPTKLSEREFREVFKASSRLLESLREFIRLRGKYPDGIADRITAKQRRQLEKVENELNGIKEIV